MAFSDSDLFCSDSDLFSLVLLYVPVATGAPGGGFTLGSSRALRLAAPYSLEQPILSALYRHQRPPADIPGMVRDSTVQYSTVEYSTVWYGMV